MDGVPYIELNFRPNVALVSVVRRFVSEFYQRSLSDPDGTSRVALATHELLENAVKYSKDGETTIRISVTGDRPKQVRIVLTNRADANNIGEMREIIDGIAKSPDAEAFYQQLLIRKVKESTGSGLGLARICAEGEMKVTYTLAEGDQVIIEAVTSVGDTPKA